MSLLTFFTYLMKYIKLILLVFFIAFTINCTSFNKKFSNNFSEHEEKITSTHLAHGIDKGDNYFIELSEKLKKDINLHNPDHHKNADNIENLLISLFMANNNSWNSSQLQRAMYLYLNFTNKKNLLVLFDSMIKTDLTAMTDYTMAWNLLNIFYQDHYSEKNQKFVAKYIEQIITAALKNNSINAHLVSEFALACINWKVTNVYDVLKLGLLYNGHVYFTQAMASMDPVKSSADFLDYLALAPDEDLRQLNFSALNHSSALAALIHLKSYPPNFGHRHLGKLFVYGSARQTDLKESALHIIDMLTPIQPNVMAYELARQKQWVQIAIIEHTRRQKTPNRMLLLANLQNISSSKIIIEELKLLNADDQTAINLNTLNLNHIEDLDEILKKETEDKKRFSLQTQDINKKNEDTNSQNTDQSN